MSKHSKTRLAPQSVASAAAPSPTAAASKPAGKRSRFFLRPSLGTAVRLLIIGLVVFVAFGVTRDRLSPASWSLPIGYSEDGLQILGWIQAASEWDYVPFLNCSITRLGAPYQANWSDFPMYEKPFTFLLGLVAHWFGLFTASNVGILLSYLTSAISFYAVSRLLRFRVEWAMAGAILFACTYYITFRHLGHLMLALPYTIPFGLLACWLVLASRRMRMGDSRFWTCLGAGLFMGLSNPYNLNMFLQLLCFSIAGHFLLRRRRENLIAGALTLALAAFGFLASNLNTLCYQMAHGKNPAAVPRAYFQSELFALKPMELFLPPANHHSEFLASLGSHYASLAWLKGELFSPYLGIVGVVGLIWMTGAFCLRVLEVRKVPRRLPAYVPQALWVVLYSVVGGLNCLVALCGVLYFRSSNRYSIFLSTLALLFLVSRLSLLARRWTPATSYTAAALVVGLGLWDQLPRFASEEQTLAIAKTLESERAFGRAMEEKLPAGAMVFQLPVVRFPEGGPVRDLQEYEMLRPYFFTKTLRFSFGAIRGRPREDWQFQLAEAPVEQLVSQLERYGFAALYINRKGFADHAESLLKDLVRLGKTQILEDVPREQVCVLLNPSATPELPHSDDNALVIYQRGWALEESGPKNNRHWAGGDASICFINEDKSARSFSLSAALATFSPRRVGITFNGQEVWSGELTPGQAVPVKVTIDAKPGRNKIYLTTDREAVSPQKGIAPIAYGVIDLQISKVPPTSP